MILMIITIKLTVKVIVDKKMNGVRSILEKNVGVKEILDL